MTILSALLSLFGAILLGGFICFLILVVLGLSATVQKYQKMAREVYTRGMWKAEGVSAHEAAAIWTRFRDVFDIPPGTATAAGVGDKYGR